MAKVSFKPVENPEKLEWKARIGRQLARARELAGLTQKELAGKFGHCDSAQLSRWEKGTETPQLAAYFAVKDEKHVAFMQQPVVIALAALAEGGVEIHTTIAIAIKRPA